MGIKRATRGPVPAIIELALAVALGAVLLAPPAAGQDGGPYGSTTTTTSIPGPPPDCQLRTRALSPGQPASATVRRVPRGDTVRLLFDGEEVARADATGPGRSPTVNVEMTFVVPQDAEPGPHEVVAVGPGFSATCQPPGGADTQVLSSEITRSRSSGLGGGLARTGFLSALLVVAAAALLLVGRLLLDVSRQRRHATARDASVAATGRAARRG